MALSRMDSSLAFSSQWARISSMQVGMYARAFFSSSGSSRNHGRWDALCAAVRYLAAVYSDHPDYRQEWEGLTDG